MNNNIDSLLESLTDFTYQSKKILQEDSTIFNRISNLQDKYISDKYNQIKLTSADREMIDNVKKLEIDEDYKVLTYSNIHHNKKYDINATCNIEFVLDEILSHMDKPEKDFNPKLINETSIRKTFNNLTKTSYRYKTMSIDDFKHEYKSIAFGTYRKELIVPDVLALTRLYEKTPYVISYIDSNLISKFINSMSKYYDKVINKFNSLSNPKLNISLKTYISCLETGIRNTLIMYQDIRSTFDDLFHEYKKIFDELIKVNKQDLLECISTNDMIKKYNSLFDKLEIITESITEIYSSNNDNIDDSHLNQKLLSSKNSKSLESFINFIKEDIEVSRNKYNSDISDIISKSGIISRITNERLNNNDNIYRIYNNILNKIDMNNFISSLNNKIDFCKTQFLRLLKSDDLNDISKYDILNELFNGTFINIDTDIMKTYNYISSKIKGDINYTKINNLNYLFDNVSEIPNYLKDISKHSIEMKNLILVILNNLKNKKYEINEIRIDLVINKIIRAYLCYDSIIFCIYKNLIEFEYDSIGLVQKLIDDLDY